MELSANPQGKITGQFTVPANIPTGTKLVQFIGDKGSYGETSYTGRGIITTEERRRVINITETRQQQTIITGRFDPLAQTFTLNQGRHIGGVDLWFTVRGDKKVVVQIRETNTGMPNQNVLAEAYVNPDDINIDGTHSRITWQPVWLEAGREYALIILTDDAETAVRIAELGKYNNTTKQWVTSQPFQVGVLLSSSNASTWTPHQDKDLTFRLLGTRFTNNTRTIDLGNTEVKNISDIIALANVERPAADTDIEIILTDESGEQIHVTDNTPLALRSRLDGKVNIKAVLRGSELNSPVLFPGLQVVLGDLVENADYISRSIPAGINSKVNVTYEAELPGYANVMVELLDATGKWQEIELTSSKPIGDGWEERVHVLNGFTADRTRVRLRLRGDVRFRARVRGLRVVVT